MSTPAQLGQYCHDQLHMLYPTVATKGKSMTSYLIPGTLTFDAILVALAYTVGRVGLPAFWADLKALYSKVRGIKVTTTPTPVVSA